MDDTAVDYTRSLYDRHANKAENKEDALRARQQGASLPLKQYHNRIKRELINAFAGGAPRLLDLACGRGGDLHKWVAAGVGYVRGVDLSPGEIEEARRRYAETKAGVEAKGGVAPDVDFEVVATLGTAAWSADGEPGGGEGDGPSASGRDGHPPPPPPPLPKLLYDAVSCMFAAHYFFSSEAAARRFLTNVAAHLKPGGFFFGTVPSGRKVQAAIRAGGRWPLLDTPALRLEARWRGEATPFGAAYTCAIKDTVTAGHEADPDSSAGSLEYLVFSSAFCGLARVCGLEPVLNWSSHPALEALLDPADEQAPFKAFVPSFPGADPSLERASELFVAFCFRRTEAALTGWEREPGSAKEAPKAPPPKDLKRVAVDDEGGEAKTQRKRVAADNEGGEAKKQRRGGAAADEEG